MSPYLHFAAGLIIIVNPIGAAPLFIALSEGMRAGERRKTAAIACVTAGIVLVAALAFGQALLAWLGIRLAAFRVGGGIVLLLMGIAMLQAQRGAISHTPEEIEEAAERVTAGAVPLGMPLLVGPGAISVAILAADHSRSWQEFALLAVIALMVAAAIWPVLIFADRLASALGKTGINIVSRVMGFLLVAIATEFMADGLVQLFPVLASAAPR